MIREVAVRRAGVADLARIVELRQERAAWLRARGSDQWSDAGLSGGEFRDRVKHSIADGQTWVAVDNDQVVIGTIAVDHSPSDGLWLPEELADAVIVHRMIVTPGAAGCGVGTLLLNRAEDVARQDSRSWVRLDAWTTNYDLHELYQRRGFKHVRTVANHSTPSAALFERKVSPGWESFDLASARGGTGFSDMHPLTYGNGFPPA